jgi:hypothetical protein
MLAISGIPIPVIRMTRAIFFPMKPQRHARAFQLPVDIPLVRHNERMALGAHYLAEELPFKSTLIQVLDIRP